MTVRTNMIVFIILLTVTSSVSSLLTPGDSRSSFLHIVQDYYLDGHVTYRQKASSVLSCAQLCLRRLPLCRSLNYGNKGGAKICELNDEGIDITKTGVTSLDSLVAMSGFIFAQLINLTDEYSTEETGNEEQTFFFTALGARGETGPSNTSGYVGTSLEGKVSLNNGIQIWTVPVTGSYVIEVSGGSGANGTLGVSGSWRIGGLGAKMQGTFQLAQGTQLKILVGQEGDRGTSFADRPGGGGGGSFVTLTNNTPLIIAGGGGGGGTSRDNFKDGDPGQATENGTRCGGTGGTGGEPCNVDSSSVVGGGAGLKGDGGGRIGISQGSLSFIKGGTGGTCPASNGGFGGGGFAFVLGGGGGGYSGGGVFGNSTSGVAGGGGSYNSGTSHQNMAGVNKGDGKVTITLKT
ncbi:Glycine rich protein [Desmophyllum pertusum]|uniref:Glycine rich protein n=1 Tax=Desmophyllum pertusum TaxID=174260 RepID=A0A9W9Z2I0_9CNID|nr:Glycine rich protein [Desmophyllum pertusum]